MEKKKVIKKAVKKPVKVDLNNKLTEIAEFIDKTIREERNKQLSTIACARLGKVKQDLIFIARNIIN